MLLKSEHVRLPIGEDWFQQSLAETIVWCTGLPIENDPEESSETRCRRELGRQAGELYRRAHLSNWPEFIKKLQYFRANRMFARARLLDVAPLDAQLRSPELKPDPFLPDHSREKSNKIIGDVVSRRAEIHRSEKRSPAPTDQLADGKLVLFSPEETLSDGGVRYSSKGFFDIHNVPPWDTWVAFQERYVIGWVPHPLVELANAGVDANPEQCILWA
jgi:hypothetical protein